MIYINRPQEAPLQYENHPRWKLEEDRIRECLNNPEDRGGKQLPGQASPKKEILGFWEAICTIFHNKCAFCESVLSTDAQLSLYRPRERARQNARIPANQSHSDHYYWLSWKWSNMYPSCDDCTKNKGFLFPVERERVKPNLYMNGTAHLYIKEKPLLLDPCLDNPANHLEFHEDGRVLAKGNSKHGSESIRVLALNRENLVNARKKHVEDLKKLLQAGLDLMDENHGTLTPEVKGLIKQLEISCEAHQPFAGMKRQLLHGWLQLAISSPNSSEELVELLKSKPWIDLIKKLEEWLKEPTLIRELLLQLYIDREDELERLCDYVRLNTPKRPDETAIKFINRIINEAQSQEKLSDVLTWIESQESIFWSEGTDDDPTSINPVEEVHPPPEPRTTATTPVRDRWALLVGINHYIEPLFPDLRFCVNDVLALEEQLKALDYTVVALHDEAREDYRIPTRDNVEAELTKLCDVAGKDDLLFVHFACHGRLVNNEPMLLTRETRDPMLAQRSLPLAVIEEKMRNSNARKLVLTLDACHVGVVSGRSPTVPSFIHNASMHSAGLALIAASTTEQIAQEWREREHGVFTYFLLEGLSGKADRDRKRYVTVNDLKDFIIDQLRKWNVKHGGVLQEPTASTEGVENIVVADYRNRGVPELLRNRVFISYSRQDTMEKEALLHHLRVLKGVNIIWSDDRIGPGADWENAIREAMTNADVAILLISANFLNPGFILDVEVPTLLRRRDSEGLTVIPVIAKECAWRQVDWLARMNVRPEKGRPIWGGDGINRVDEDLAAIVQEVAAILSP